MNKLVTTTISILVFLTLTTNVDAKCTPIYNGGEGACLNTSSTVKSPTTSQTTTQPTPTPKVIAYAQPITTKGGFPVTQTQKTTTTPSTGASENGMTLLIITGIAGVLLRKKAAFTAH